jgi:hypothetical protein
VWLVAAVFAACLLVSFGRRRYELATGARAERPALADLTVAFLDHLVVISTCLTAVSAWLYLDLDAPTGRYRTWILILLFPLVLLLLFRYLALVMLHKQGGDAVATISGDRTLVGVAGLAGLVFGLTVVATYLSVR